MSRMKCKIFRQDLRDEVQFRACVKLLVRGCDLVASRPVRFTPDEMAYSVLGEEALNFRRLMSTIVDVPHR